MSVNEWPEPTALTVVPAAADLTAATSSSRVEGRTTSTGAQRWFPPQLDHSAAGRRAPVTEGAPAPPNALLPPSAAARPPPAAPGLLLGLDGVDQLGQDLVDVTDHA